MADAEGSVEEVNDYYPFGGLMSNTTGNEFQPYKYNGKELDRKAGLNLYDYGARFYDPAIGRFSTVDPMTEKYLETSSYVYCNDNPLKYIDPTGKEWLTKEDEEYAKRLTEEMNKKIESELKRMERMNKRIERKLRRGRSVTKEQHRVAEKQAYVDNLKAGISELTEMGKTTEQKFTYKPISGDIGYTSIDSQGTIVMEVSGTANGIHESSHGYDIWKNGVYTKQNLLKGEIKAYGRQFSYDSNSLPTSFFGVAESLDDINERWILGLSSQTEGYIYVKILHPQKDVMEILKRLQ